MAGAVVALTIAAAFDIAAHTLEARLAGTRAIREPCSVLADSAAVGSDIRGLADAARLIQRQASADTTARTVLQRRANGLAAANSSPALIAEASACGHSTSTTSRARCAHTRTKQVLAKVAKGAAQIAALALTSLALRRRHIAAQHGAVVTIEARVTSANAAIHGSLQAVDTRQLACRAHPVWRTASAVGSARAQIGANTSVVAGSRADRNLTANPRPTRLACAGKVTTVAGAMTTAVQRRANGRVQHNPVDDLHHRATARAARLFAGQTTETEREVAQTRARIARAAVVAQRVTADARVARGALASNVGIHKSAIDARQLTSKARVVARALTQLRRCIAGAAERPTARRVASTGRDRTVNTNPVAQASAGLQRCVAASTPAAVGIGTRTSRDVAHLAGPRVARRKGVAEARSVGQRPVVRARLVTARSSVAGKALTEAIRRWCLRKKKGRESELLIKKGKLTTKPSLSSKISQSPQGKRTEQKTKQGKQKGTYAKDARAVAVWSGPASRTVDTCWATRGIDIADAAIHAVWRSRAVRDLTAKTLPPKIA